MQLSVPAVSNRVNYFLHSRDWRIPMLARGLPRRFLYNCEYCKDIDGEIVSFINAHLCDRPEVVFFRALKSPRVGKEIESSKAFGIEIFGRCPGHKPHELGSED
jgi:hypothetical protein